MCELCLDVNIGMFTLSRKLTWLFEKNAQLRDDYLKLKRTWKQEIGKGEVLVWLFMKPIENLSLKDCIKRMNGQITLRDRGSILCGELEMRNKFSQESLAINCTDIEELRRICCAMRVESRARSAAAGL